MPGAGSVIRVQLLTEVHRAGTNTPSTRTPLDPLEFIPSVTPSPQSSRTVTWSRGMTSTMFTGPSWPSRAGTSALPMKWVAWAIPEQ